MWQLKVVTPATTEPLDLDTEVKQQLRLDASEVAAQAAVLAGYIGAARRACEAETGRQLITTVWELWMDSWYEEGIYRCGRIRLPKPPATAVGSVKYYDTAGVLQTWATDQYLTSFPSGECAGYGEISAAYGVALPTVQERTHAIQIQFSAGYGATYADIPKALKAGMLMDVQSLHDAPEPAVAKARIEARDALFWPFKVW